MQRHAELREHQHAVLLNASLCRRGIAQRCYNTRAPALLLLYCCVTALLLATGIMYAASCRCYNTRALVVPSIDALAQVVSICTFVLVKQVN